MVTKYLDKRIYTLYLFPFLLGCLTVLSFKPFNFTFINFLVLPIFFYLIVYIKKKSKGTYRKKPFRKNLFIYGTSFGFGYFLSGIHWISHSLTFDENFKILIPLGLILIPLFLSLFFSIFTVLIGPLISLNLNSIFFFSGGLAFFDYLRAKILTGFPWNLWAYSVSQFTEITQILNIIGLFAFNLILITVFTLPSVLFFSKNFREKFLLLLTIPSLFLLFYIFGSYLINQNLKNLETVKEKYKVKVVSPNFKLKYGLSYQELETRLNKLVKFSEPNGNFKTIFVWPEGVFSGYSFDEIIIFEEIFLNNFNKNHLILFGVNRFDENLNGFYNSMVIVNNKLEILQEYKKQKLVPFGEFLPFEKILNKFGLKKITEGHGSFLKGHKQKNLKLDKLNILPLICYEIIFTKLVQKSHEKTNLIINISEDGWFGNSIGPYQHFTKAIFRAIEHNSFLIRSANKGISAIIDNKGKVVKKLNPTESGNIELDVPLLNNKNKNRNDLIFFILLFTYIFIFKIMKKNNGNQ